MRLMGSMMNKDHTMDESAKILVDTLISTKKVVIFSKSYCPYAKKAKTVIGKYPIKSDQLEIIELEKRPDCNDVQAYLKELTGTSTVPRVFIDGKCVGGGDDVKSLDNEGQLESLLRDCGALV